MSDAAGDYLFKLRLVKLKDEALVAEIGIQASVNDINLYTELALNMANLQFPETGKYEFQLYAGDVYLHRVTMNAILAEGGR